MPTLDANSNFNQTRATLEAVAPKLRCATRIALRSVRRDPWSTRPAFIGYAGISFVVDTPALPIGAAAFEQILEQEQRDGVRLRLEKRRGVCVPVLDLAVRHAWSVAWLYDYALAAFANGQIAFVAARHKPGHGHRKRRVASHRFVRGR